MQLKYVGKTPAHAEVLIEKRTEYKLDLNKFKNISP